MTLTKRILVTVACLITCLTLNAQDKELLIKYQFEKRIPSSLGDKDIHKTVNKTELYADVNGVISRTQFGEPSLRGVITFLDYVRKDFQKNTILSIENMRKMKVLLKEELNLFN
ncbi:hypothetical protein [Marinifilum sp.]|uniref:hypothetical protein n=1 Tax=Marinifilum sp. TaxID=2033137 RepID=UPI003BACD2B9